MDADSDFGSPSVEVLPVVVTERVVSECMKRDLVVSPETDQIL